VTDICWMCQDGPQVRGLSWCAACLEPDGDHARVANAYAERLQGWKTPDLGSDITVAIVGCSGPKLDVPGPARDLYTSPLFRAARAYAEALGGPWVIASALHGILMPWYVTEPYDETHSTMLARALGDSTGETRARYRAWWLADRAKAQQASLRRRFGCWDTRYVFLAGEAYRGCVADIPGRVAAPLEGLGIGDRIAWLRRETAALVAAREAA